MIKDDVDVPTPFIFPKNTMVEVERGDRYWYTIKEEIADFPETHANIIINEVYIASNPPCPRN